MLGHWELGTHYRKLWKRFPKYQDQWTPFSFHLPDTSVVLLFLSWNYVLVCVSADTTLSDSISLAHHLKRSAYIPALPLVQCNPKEPSAVMEMFQICLSNAVVISYTQLLSIWNITSEIRNCIVKLSFVVIDLNSNSDM